MLSLAPQVGLEPTTTRLTAECSAIELLRNMGKRSFDTPFSHGIRRRPTLPGRVQPSTIGAEGLNFCVRDGNRWDPFAITTGNLFSRFGTFLRPPLPASQLSASSGLGISPYLDNCTDFGLLPFARLVSVFLKSSPRPISISKLPCYHAYTADLSPGSLPGVLLV